MLLLFAPERLRFAISYSDNVCMCPSGVSMPPGRSGVTSEYLEADRNGEDCGSVTSISTSAVLDRSLKDPGALSGLRVAVAGYGVGLVLGYERKKFRSTRFRVLFDDGKVKLLKLKRSAKKGVVPFTVLQEQQQQMASGTIDRAVSGNDVPKQQLGLGEAQLGGGLSSRGAVTKSAT